MMFASTRFPDHFIQESAKVFLIHFFVMVGLPRIIQTDQGTNFTSELFQQLLETLNMKSFHWRAYHPQSHEASERFHSTIKNMIRTFCLENQKNSDDGVPFLMFTAREAVQVSTGFSPNLCLDIRSAAH